MGLFSHKAKFPTNVLSWGSSLHPKKFHKWIAKKNFLRNTTAAFFWVQESIAGSCDLLVHSSRTPQFHQIFLNYQHFQLAELPFLSLKYLQSHWHCCDQEI